MSVIHAHPPGATGFAVAHKAMDMYNMIEDVAVIGAVPLTPLRYSFHRGSAQRD